MPHPDDTAIPGLSPELIRRYHPVERPITAGGTTFHMLAVADTNALLEEIHPDDFAGDERLPYWADIWTSSMAMAAYCLDVPGLRGLEVIELGCGLGLAGIATAAAGARVVMTDYEPDALAFARCNVERNLPGALAAGTVRIELMDWRTVKRHARYDRVIGADIAYERLTFPAILQTVDLLLKKRGVAVFTDPERSMGADFAALAGARGFRVVSTREPAPEHDATRTVVRYELHRREAG